MQFKTHLLIAALSLASVTQACVGFQAEECGGDFHAMLQDEGDLRCTNIIGTNTAESTCDQGYSMSFDRGSETVTYGTPHGNFNFQVLCHQRGDGGDTCLGTAFCPIP